MKVLFFLTSSLNTFSKSVVENIVKEKDLEVAGAIIDCAQELSLRKKLIKNVRQGRGGYVIVMAYQKWLGSKEVCFDTKSVMAQWQVPILEIENPYSKTNLNQIRDFKADIGVLISAFGIVKSPLIQALPKGILSYHHGDMRRYRGQPPAFWELYHDESEIGVTVQRINRKLDSGEIILEKTFAIDQSDTLTSLERKIFQGSQAMMKMALLHVNQPDFQGVFLKQFGRVYTLPNLRQWLKFNIKMLKRRVMGFDVRRARGLNNNLKGRS